jgi:hypothetical protein
MAKRTAREFAANMEQQMKQFKPVRGEHRQSSTVHVQTTAHLHAASL